MKKKLKLAAFLFLAPFLLNAQTRGQQEPPDALAEYRAGNYQAAIDICKTEIAAVPENIDSYVVAGWCLLRLGRYEEARTFAQNGRRFSYYDARLVEILGEVGYFQGQNAEALKLFEEYINLAPDGARIDFVYYYIGEIFIRQGRFRHADISLSTALYYVPLDAAWWIRLGYARERYGNKTEALSAYERALSLDGRLSDAKRGIERVKTDLTR
jgi:tetratricopeptide (TPR) repeat protein